MKQLDKCIKFLEKNGYKQRYIDDTEEEYQIMYKENQNISDININDDEIVFVGENGDWLNLPLNFYALLGALIHYHQIDIGYKT